MSNTIARDAQLQELEEGFSYVQTLVNFDPIIGYPPFGSRAACPGAFSVSSEFMLPLVCATPVDSRIIIVIWNPAISQGFNKESLEISTDVMQRIPFEIVTARTIDMPKDFTDWGGSDKGYQRAAPKIGPRATLVLLSSSADLRRARRIDVSLNCIDVRDSCSTKLLWGDVGEKPKKEPGDVRFTDSQEVGNYLAEIDSDDPRVRLDENGPVDMGQPDAYNSLLNGLVPLSGRIAVLEALRKYDPHGYMVSSFAYSTLKANYLSQTQPSTR
jgi:hypothetical protein